MRKTLSEDAKKHVAELYVSGDSVREISEKTGISMGSVSNIIKKFSEKLQKYDIHAMHEFYGIEKKLNLNPNDAFRGFAVFSVLSKNNIECSNEFVESVLVYSKKNNLTSDQLINLCKKISHIQSSSDVSLDEMEEYCNALLKRKNTIESDISNITAEQKSAEKKRNDSLQEKEITSKQLINLDGVIQFLRENGIQFDKFEYLYNMLKNAEKQNYDMGKITNHITQYKSLDQAITQKQKEHDKINSDINKAKKDYQELSLRYENISLRHKSLKDSIAVIESLQKSGITPEHIAAWGKIFDSFGIDAEEFEKKLRYFGSKEKLDSTFESKISALERKISSLEKKKTWLEENVNKIELEISNGTEYSKKSLAKISKQTKKDMNDIFDNYFNDVESFKLKCVNEISKTQNDIKIYFDQQKSLFEKFIEDTIKTSKETQKLELVKPIYDMLQGKAKLVDSLSLMIILLDRLEVMMKSQVKDWHVEFQVTEFRKILVGLLSKK